MSWGVAFLLLSLLFVGMAVIFGRPNNTSLCCVLTFIALGFCIIGATEMHIHNTYKIVEFESCGESVTRFYDYNGNVIEEFHGNITMTHETNGMTVEQKDNGKIVFINNDGEIVVVEE